MDVAGSAVQGLGDFGFRIYLLTLSVWGFWGRRPSHTYRHML